MAAELEVTVHGTAFLDAYTQGDNRRVVATDTMKNFIHAASLRSRARRSRTGCSTSGPPSSTRTRDMERLTMVGRDLPFPAALVPADDGDGFAASEVLFAAIATTARPPR